MDKKKADGVVEAVHYGQDKQIAWVRVYERRGPTYSDVTLMDRNSLVEHIKSGKKFFSGKRVPRKASTFVLSQPFKLIQAQGKEILVANDTQADHDDLGDVPII